jgi:hypothetical protein
MKKTRYHLRSVSELLPMPLRENPFPQDTPEGKNVLLRREDLIAPDGHSELDVINNAKIWAGITGKVRIVRMGETIAIYPRKSNSALFITPSH